MSEYDFDKESETEGPPPEQRDPPPGGYRPPPWSQPEPPRRSSAPPPGGYQNGPYQQRSGGYDREPYPRTYDQNQNRGQSNTYRRSNQTPYQYSANNGWQQPPQKQQKYEWDFAEYDQALPNKQRKGKNRGLVIFAVALLCVLAVGLLSLTGYNIVRFLTETTPPADAANSESAQLPSAPHIDRDDEVSMNIAGKPPVIDEMPEVGEKMTIPQVAKAVRPAVVGVVNYQSSAYFEPTTEGSGIILSEDGYIITNAHVVDQADAIVIIFDDETEFEAALVGADARTDLAVLKVDRNDLVPAIFGDSNELEVGETVIAIGNPGGIELAGSVTQGIVSAVNRVVKNPYYSTNYIQTDAAINPGNSGGALCNEYGQVVGINSAKIIAEGYEGISFAIPISEAIPIIDDLIRNGRVTGRVLLGITGNPISELYARERNIPAGVQIASITSEELTRRGVMRGDIITHIDDERVFDVNDIYTILQQHGAGDTVKLTLFRQTSVTQNKTFDVVVPLMEDTGQ